ncbi:MAG: hypothetical protein MJA83_05700 [Gammaproteobacteria bacterium]|nr:hypothetical protein [Gammaproteobacteria bacterium]
MSQQSTLKMTAGDNDQFIVTLKGVDLSAADFFRIRMERPTTVLEKDGTAVDLANGRFLILFDSASDLVEGKGQAVDVKWSIGGVVLTSKERFFIDVKKAI